MACVSGMCGAGARPTQQMSAPGQPGLAGAAAGGGQDLMSKVKEILEKAGVLGEKGDSGALSADDIKRLLEALSKMGSDGVKQVLAQAPALTQTLGQVM